MPFRQTPRPSVVRHLTLEEVRADHQCARYHDPTRGPRPCDAASLLCGRAARVGLVGLPLENVSLQRTPSIRVLGKGRKERCLPLWKETAADLRAWLASGERRRAGTVRQRRGIRHDPGGLRVCAGQTCPRCQESCASLRGRSVSPHQLRHSCALMMLGATGTSVKWDSGSVMQISARPNLPRGRPEEKLEAESGNATGLRRGRFKAPDALIGSLFEPG